MDSEDNNLESNRMEIIDEDPVSERKYLDKHSNINSDLNKNSFMWSQYNNIINEFKLY